ncbi:MAG: NinB protein [Bacteriophage sp.]|nr:MAG: NinB protein [Bacteriophage sp.]
MTARDRRVIKLYEPEQAHSEILSAWRDTIKPMLQAGKRLVIQIRPEKRSDAMNRRMWSMLNDVSEQVEWYGHYLSPEEWKCIFTASWKKSRSVPGIDGGLVVCGLSTSDMTNAEMSELMSLMEAFGANNEVAFKAYGDQDEK